MLKKALIFPFGLLAYLFTAFLDAVTKCEQDIRDALDERAENRRAAWLITLDPDRLAESGKLEDAILAGQARVAQGIGYKNQSGRKTGI